MGDYIFWADLFETWKSSSDWIKALLIITPPAFGLGALALILHHRARMRTEPVLSGLYQWMREGKQPLAPQNARKLPQNSISVLHAETFEPQKTDDEESRALARKIIAEEYRRGRPPGETLERVRQFLLDREM